MADKTGIAWTNATWNPITGCTKVSQGCKHCYAEREWGRLSVNPKAVSYFGRAFTDVACHEERLDQPLRWRKPRMIFVNSMSDLFHESVPDAFINQIFAVMALANQHIFQVLTKRPERMLDWFATGYNNREHEVGHAMREIAAAHGFDVAGIREWPIPNVWLGVSAEDQETADARIPILMQVPAALRWVSAEPLLGPIDFEEVPVGMFGPLRPYQASVTTFNQRINWVVAGGESGFGSNVRPMHPDWVASIQEQCEQAKVPFFFKQWGEWLPLNQMTPEYAASLYRSNRSAKDGEDQNELDDEYGTQCIVLQKVIIHNGQVFSVDDPRSFEQDFFGTRSVFRVGVHKAGCKLNGREWQSWPANLNLKETF